MQSERFFSPSRGNERRVYDFTPNLIHKFYKQLSDIRLFKNVQVVDGEIEWATGQDFCPHTLYENSTVYIEEKA